MKLKKLLTKSLLTAAGLLVGVNAWAEDTYTSVYSRAAVTEWTTDDKTDWGGSTNLNVDATNGLGFNVNMYSTTTELTASKSFTVSANAKVKYEFSWYFGSAINNAGSYAFVRFGDFVLRWWNNGYSTSFSTNGTDFTIFNAGCTSNTTYTKDVEILFNTATNAVEKFSFGGTDFTSSVTGSVSGTISDVSFGYIRGGRAGNWTYPNYLKTFKVSQAQQTVSTANYTINYIYNAEAIKTVNGTEVIGNTVNAESPITIDGQKYFAVDGANTSMTIESGTNELNVELRQAATYAYTVNAVDGSNNILKEITAGSTVEGEAAAAFGYPQYLKVGDVLYQSTRFSSSIYYEYSGYTPTADNAVLNITYTATDISTLWFSEGENIDGASANSANNTNIRCSNATGAQFGSVTNVVTLPAGTYTLHAQIWGNSGTNFTFMAGTSQIGEETTFSTNGNLHTNSAEFTLTETTTITVLGGANGKVIDWIYITGTPSNEIIGALDFSTGFMDDSKSMTIKEGETITATFKNHGNGVENWYNWLVRLSGVDGVDDTFRADNFVLGTNANTVSITEDEGAIVWDDFKADMKDADVVMTISYGLDGMLTIAATSTGAAHTYVHNFAYNDAKSGEITVDLGVEKAWLEVVSVEKESTKVTATIGTYGLATFSSTYALDFTDVTDVIPYVVTGEDNNVIIRERISGKVAANTGLVLKSANGGAVTAVIPAATDGTVYNITTATKNYLVAVSEETTVSEATVGTNYVLSVQAGKVVFAPIGDVNATVKAGQAYLAMPESSTGSARALFFDEGDATAIQAVESLTEQGQEVYNLQGLRVSQPQKGLYIVNGKIVIKK